MNFLHMNLGILDSVFGWMVDLVNQVFGAVFILLINLFNLVFGAIMFQIAAILGALVDFFQGVFRSLAGIGTFWDGKNRVITNQDPIFTMITSDVVWKTFLIMLAIAFVLVIIMAIIAIIRNEYNTDKANNTKGGVLGAAVKSIAFFAITPVVTVLGVLGCNMLLRVLDTATGGQETPVSGQVFAASAYGANYMRLTDRFDQFNGLGTIAQGLVEGMNRLFAVTNYGDADSAKSMIYSLNNTLYDTQWVGQEGGKEKIAASVDAAFAQSMVVTDEGNFVALQAAAVANGLTSVLLGGQTTLISNLLSGVGSASLTRLNWTNAPVVAMYYRMSDINYIVLIGGMIMALWVMYTSAFGLMIRLYKCTMLFIVAPPVIALGPMDNMSAFGNWRKQFVGQALGAYGVVIGMNLAFKLITVTNNINLFNPTSASGMAGNMLIHALMSIAALYMMKDFIKMVSGFVGGEDVAAGGADLAKKTVKTGLAVGAIALTGGAAAAGGIASGAIKGAGAIGKGAKALGSQLYHAGEVKDQAGNIQHQNWFARGVDKVGSAGRFVSNSAKAFGNTMLGVDEEGNEKNTFRRRAFGKLKEVGSAAATKVGDAVGGFVDDHITSDVAAAGRKKNYFSILNTVIGAASGGVKTAGGEQGAKWLSGNLGKTIGGMNENNDSELGKLVAMNNARKAQKTFLSGYNAIDTSDEIRSATEEFSRHSTTLGKINGLDKNDPEYSKKRNEILKEDGYKNYSSFMGEYNKSSANLNALTNKGDDYTKSVNDVMKAYFNIDDATFNKMSTQERNEKLSQMAVQAKLTPEQVYEALGKTLEGDKGGLKAPDASTLASALGSVFSEHDQKINQASIDAIASGIAAAISGEAEKMSEKIIGGLKGEDLQSTYAKQTYDSQKRMEELIKQLIDVEKNKK